uniref:Uncharacterized protein n=1 Tax=Aspergillus fumigatus TaxID=746128 RepID=Q6MYS9_ASPFM|nr:hypothetical protein AfA28D1.080 [Aspergillus fumigatus]
MESQRLGAPVAFAPLLSLALLNPQTMKNILRLLCIDQ